MTEISSYFNVAFKSDEKLTGQHRATGTPTLAALFFSIGPRLEPSKIQHISRLDDFTLRTHGSSPALF